jgi:hypothetical protein
MPSTFTPSGVELIAAGEQSGLWGDTTNTNLQIIDRLTSQVGTISLSGTTHTLTISDGVLSDGQYGVLVFAGSPSGTNTVTINPNTAQRVFVVRNTTAQSIIIAQGSGTTVTVPTGTTKIVSSNGAGTTAAVLDVTSTLAANLIGNVTGALTGNASTATALQTARTIGGVSFNGTADINLPGVDQAGNQDTTGNAATATALQTARNINGVSFDGTANITIPTVPSGGIIMWSGSIASIPSGWFLCDGANGTPDLRNRFVVGAGSTYAVNATGGSADAIVVSHTHTATVTDPGHAHGYDRDTLDNIASGSFVRRMGTGADPQTTTTATTGISVGISTTGSSGTNANLPPYFALAYIMKS